MVGRIKSDDKGDYKQHKNCSSRIEKSADNDWENCQWHKVNVKFWDVIYKHRDKYHQHHKKQQKRNFTMLEHHILPVDKHKCDCQAKH